MASRFYNLSTDNTLGGVSPSDAIVSSQKAIKAYMDGVTSNIQDQLDNKENTLTAGSNITLTTISTIGKNKLDANVDGIKVTATPTSDLAINFTKWYLGAAFNGYMNQSIISGFTYGVGTITFKSSDASYGCVKFLRLKPSTTYTISCASPTSNHRAAIMCYNDNGDDTYKATTQIQTPTALPYSFTTNADPTQVYGIDLYSPTNTEITYTNILLEEGNQATTYAPYTELFSTQVAATDTTYNDFTGATAGDAGASGLVPAPAAGDQAKFLQGDGTWATPTAFGANTDLSNLTSTGKNISNWTSNVTNCITERPQDIKLELNNGTLTLKAGSKVWLPNGVGVNTQITVANDLTVTDNQNRKLFIGLNANGAILVKCVGSETGSPVAGTYKYYYDSTVNKCYQSAASSTPQATFPIAIVTATSADGIVSIDQVFNDFGYIGSTMFALPGVKGLISNGRNADGTLNSIAFTITNVLTQTNTYLNNTFDWYINSSLQTEIGYTQIVSTTQPSGAYQQWYNPDTNMCWNTMTGTAARRYNTPLLRLTVDSSSKITSINPKPVFHAADYSDTVTINGKQDIKGAKTFTTNPTILHGANPALLITNTDNDSTTAPAANEICQVLAQDKNLVWTGGLQVVHSTSGSNTAQILVRKQDASVSSAITIGYNSSGTVFTSAPASDANNSILTTLTKSKTQSGYYRLGNGLLIQWMCGISPTSDTAYSLPTAFTSGTSYSTVVVHATSGDDAFVTTPYGQTATTVRFHRGGGVGSPYNVICIGY